MKEKMLRIGQVATRIGVSAHAIRYYERIGVLPAAARTAAGYRQYSDSSLGRICIVRNAVRFGFSLKQIAGFIHARDHGYAPCREVRSAGEEVLAKVNREIEALKKSRKAILKTLQTWDHLLVQAGPNAPARLLEKVPFKTIRRSSHPPLS